MKNVAVLVLSAHFVAFSPTAQQYLPSLAMRDVTQEG